MFRALFERLSRGFSLIQVGSDPSTLARMLTKDLRREEEREGKEDESNMHIAKNSSLLFPIPSFQAFCVMHWKNYFHLKKLENVVSDAFRFNLTKA